jgi:hypothetical protein
MFTPKQYRAKAAQYTQLLKTTRSPAETREFRKLEQSYITLAENDEWLAENREKTHGQSTPDNWYDDIILAQQKKHTLGCLGTMQLTEIPTKIQQLFDDAGSMGGLVQTARLRGQIARFLHKHNDHDFSSTDIP